MLIKILGFLLSVILVAPALAKAPTEYPTELLYIQGNTLKAVISPSFYALDGVMASIYDEYDKYHLLAELELCESSGNIKAINPKDTDGTPSYGILQFKISTLKMYAERYGFVYTDVWDYELQRVVFARMLEDPRVNFAREFPACYKKLRTLFLKVGK